MHSIRSSNNGLSRSWEEVLFSGINYFKNNLHKRGSSNLTIHDFDILKTVGTGGFGRVVLARDKRDQGHYAIKILKKALVLQKKQTAHVLNEKMIMQAIKFPFLVNLLNFFKDPNYLYFVMPFYAGGELYQVLQRAVRMGEDQARFYGAQLVLSLEFLHELGVAYRDLKPENILLDSRGYLRLTDLGFCKLLGPQGRTYTVCGTPEYLAPEVINALGYGVMADMWSLGVLLWELCAGTLPFYNEDRFELFSAITRGERKPCPSDFSDSFLHLLAGLLQADPASRMDPVSTRGHIWFCDTHWIGIINQTVIAPFIPQLAGPDDTRYYDLYPEEDLEFEPLLDPNEDYFKDF